MVDLLLEFNDEPRVQAVAKSLSRMFPEGTPNDVIVTTARAMCATQMDRLSVTKQMGLLGTIVQSIVANRDNYIFCLVVIQQKIAELLEQRGIEGE